MPKTKPVFVVEKGVPMPPRQRGCGTKSAGVKLIYPFDKMEVTDSILIPAGQKWQVVYVCALQYGMRHGLRFENRTVDDGARIWRVE